ncbi:cysteine-rich small domain-containing protein [Chromatium okenii]|jgi:Zn-finger protein|uniref:Cobalamine-related hypothetical metal-binding protein CrdX n=1 Tax=Chromatium okenii TaxID=61644 RepID=A0A2S7XTM0_9GAMM|nr:cysteine-rich small domain-containing protein [Chromatium okenii]PQJ97084.1 cobalamine-related hypothetical metal-binding protein CrdX [Chromatium okenii]
MNVAASFQGFTNTACAFYPCHSGIHREFNCLFCYCPLYAYNCPGTYSMLIDRHGQPRKDCSQCRLPHDGYAASWQFIQKWLEQPTLWSTDQFKDTHNA